MESPLTEEVFFFFVCTSTGTGNGLAFPVSAAVYWVVNIKGYSEPFG